jgi:hypothetical protein
VWAIVGWVARGQLFGPYQINHLIKALQTVKKKLR